jgi:hypothetical protein
MTTLHFNISGLCRTAFAKLCEVWFGKKEGMSWLAAGEDDLVQHAPGARRLPQRRSLCT